jgi:hypothetical protein
MSELHDQLCGRQQQISVPGGCAYACGVGVRADIGGMLWVAVHAYRHTEVMLIGAFPSVFSDATGS